MKAVFEEYIKLKIAIMLQLRSLW